MDSQEAIRHMVKASGRSATDISRSIGKNHNYISVVLSQGSDPKTANFARIAHECGYKLMLVGEGETIELYSRSDAVAYTNRAGLSSGEMLSDLAARYAEPQAAYTNDSGVLHYDDGTVLDTTFFKTLVDATRDTGIDLAVEGDGSVYLTGPDGKHYVGKAKIEGDGTILLTKPDGTVQSLGKGATENPLHPLHGSGSDESDKGPETPGSSDGL